MTNDDYKKYSLGNLSNWFHDAISSSEATPEEIYDTVKEAIQEEYSYYLDKLSRISVLSHRFGVSTADLIKPKLHTNDVVDFTTCDANDTSPECMTSWNSFWNDDKINFTNPIVTTPPYVSEDGDVWGKDKVRKWVLPVEVDGLTGDCVVTLPDDLLERVGWVEGDTVEFVSNTNGSFTVKKVVKSEVENI
jgi:hypothetical protein